MTGLLRAALYQPFRDLAYRQQLQHRIDRQSEDQAWLQREREYQLAFRLWTARLRKEGCVIVP